MKRLIAVFVVFAFYLPAALWAEEGPPKEGAPPQEGHRPEDKAKSAALDPVVVTATRTPKEIRKVGKSISVVTSEEIERRGDWTVPQAIRNLPSVTTRRMGGPGAFQRVQIRGSQSDQVLFMIDGMPITDPSSFGNGATAFLEDLLTDDIDRIEVLRGPQTTLYGSDAMGGVVNIITKRGTTEKPSFRLQFEGGTEFTFKEKGNVSGDFGWGDYFFNVTQFNSDGIDAHDDVEETSLTGRVDVRPLERLEVENVIRYSRSRKFINDYDFFTNRDIDDPNYRRWADFLFWGTRATLNVAEWWDSVAAFNIVDSRRRLRDNLNPFEIPFPTDFYKGIFEGTTFNLDVQQNFYPAEWNTLTVGFEWQQEKADTESYYLFAPTFPDTFVTHVRNLGWYVEDQVEFFDRLFLTGGIRVDDHQRFGTECTGEVSGAYLVKETGTKLKANWGTGFKAPSPIELGDPLYGNPNLDPERNWSMDFGLEQKLLEEVLKLGCTFFYTRYRDLISFDPLTFRSINVGRARVYGFELEARSEPVEDLEIVGSYTFTRSRDREDGGRLDGVPNNQFGLDVYYRFFEKFSAQGGLTYTGDNRFGAYTNYDRLLANATLSYDVTDFLTVYGRVENAFNDTRRVDGFRTAGTFFFGGAKAKF